MPERPFIKFFTSDWLGDTKLRRCSRNAKGVMIDLMCWMNDSPEIGYLVRDGRASTDSEVLIDLAGDRTADQQGLDELLKHGVLLRDDRGVIHCPRMVRDAHTYDQKAFAGRQGGFAKAARASAIAPATAESSNLLEHPLGSSFCASGICNGDGESEGKGARIPRLPRVTSDQIDVIWRAYPRRVGKKKAVPYIRAAIRKIGPEELLQAVQRYATEREGQEEGYTPHPERWFKNERWTDEPGTNRDAKPMGSSENAARVREGAENYANRGQVIEAGD